MSTLSTTDRSSGRADPDKCSRYLLSWDAFVEVPSQAVRAAAHHWTCLTLNEGEMLWAKGNRGFELALVVSGELWARTEGDVVVGVIRPWEMAGEATAFLEDSYRTATLRAARQSDVLLLTRTALRNLRIEHPPVYQALLEHAVHTLARRVRNASVTVSAEALRHKLPEVPLFAARDGSRGHLLRRGFIAPPDDARTVLRRLPQLRLAAEAALDRLARAFTLEPVDGGETIFESGEVGLACYLIASGELDIRRQVGTQIEVLARMRSGSPIGINALIDGGCRTATCVARVPSWLMRMDFGTYHLLKGEPRQLWHEVMLSSLATQLGNENRILRRVPARSLS